MNLPDTRAWIEKAATCGGTIYLIVGITTLTDIHLIRSSAQDRNIKGKADIPISIALSFVGIPLLGPLDPAICGNFQNVNSTRSQVTATGEYVCALQYRKVRFRWFLEDW